MWAIRRIGIVEWKDVEWNQKKALSFETGSKQKKEQRGSIPLLFSTIKRFRPIGKGARSNVLFDCIIQSHEEVFPGDDELFTEILLKYQFAMSFIDPEMRYERLDFMKLG